MSKSRFSFQKAVRFNRSVTSHRGKPAEDPESYRGTPRRWRVLSHAIPSARFWSAAVLCRFQLILPRLPDTLNHTLQKELVFRDALSVNNLGPLWC
jgi:hypothetical protein